jgi:acetolactate synthase-1/2/3 large subunit
VRTSEQIADMLKSYGVTHFFFTPVIAPPLMKVAVEIGITPIMTHGEKAAAYMADGYARVSGRPGVCGAQHVGSTNLASGLRDGYMARSPIVAMSGSSDTDSRYKGLYQDVDDHGAFEAMTKWNVRVDDPARLPDLLRQAFRAATCGAPRPVHLELPGMQGNISDADAGGDSFAEERFARAPSYRVPADAEVVADAAASLAGAERPIILAGNGVIRSRAVAVLRAFARDRALPVVTTMNGMSAIAHADPLFAGVVGDYGSTLGNRVVHEADVILVVGSALGSMTTRKWSVIADGTKILQIDIEPLEIGRNYHSAAPMVGDARTVLRQLAQTPAFTTPSAWTARVGEIRDEYAAKVRDVETSAEVPMRPERLVTMLSAEIADTAVVVLDTGHSGHWSGQHLKLGAETTLIRAAGSLGWGVPAGIGAKCAVPDREVVVFTGDGGFYWHMAELETARRNGIPVIVVVNNNVSLNQEQYIWDTANPKHHNYWKHHDTDIVAISRGLGAFATRVDDPAEFASAFKEARNSGLPAVLDVRTSIDAMAPKENIF